ncbi:ImmA/IrrE family metallo-endopeptidase [Rathayibacter sp. AY1A3]|uniref:ImmA/IrrE family metallo-endopeptidase n=1 Tax=Rathayibacter sp. AY1A3 TaxID=2080521 RepID=UPI000CE891CA|nr:ImmA/IrrE family metallo-endopeptidase [Rathayibacter sp. AY1A3]PPF36353.1 hypothetical protein C5C10_07040 [Rathayibacter sp. AY1A3]
MVVLVKDAAREAAVSTVAAFWRGGVPVDPYAVAKNLGIRVFERSLPEGTSGFIRKLVHEDAEVYLETSHSKLRKRFTLAHEIGHYIERTEIQDKPDEDFGFVEKRGGRTDVHEFFANEFAANLLMPEEAIRSAYKRERNAILLAAEFQVSVSAMRLRLDKLRLLE